MRIALSTSVIQRGKTGVAQYVFALTRALLRHAGEHEISLLVLQEDMSLFDFAKDQVRLVPIDEEHRPPVKNILWHQRKLPQWLKRERVDVVHVPSYRRMMAFAPCARVATIHDLAPFHVRGKYDLARMFYGRVVVKHLARQQDAVIAISGNTGRDIERFFGLALDGQNIILNGLDHERFRPGDADAARAALPEAWRFEAPYFLYISRLEHPAKKHVRLIEAFNQFKAQTDSSWLLVLGGSDWHGAEAIHAKAKESPYADDIRFLGFVPDNVLPMLYQSAAGFVYPSLFEGFGLPPVEAMACGCPVISSTRGSLDEVVAQAAERIDPENVEAMMSALGTVATNGVRRRELIAAGLENAKRFEWGKNAAQVLDVYTQVVKGFHRKKSREII